MADAPDDMPRSLVDVRTAVRLALGLGGALSILPLMLVCGARECWIPLVTFLPPVVTWFFVGGAAARGERARAAMLLVAGIVAHLVIGFFVAACMSVGSDAALIVLILVAVLLAGTGAAAVPVIASGALLASKKDFEAGDLMLGLGGAWLALLEAAEIASLGVTNERGGAAVLFMLFGCALGVGAMGVFVARAIARRKWCARVARGDLQGWRVRVVTSPVELAALPPLFGSAKRVSAVVERVELAGLLYRSGLVGQPVAAVRLAPSLAPSLTP